MIVAAAAPAAAGCGTAGRAKGGGVRVVASTTMLGDVVGQIMACAGGESITLMPVGADPHEYAPSSADVVQMVKADLVVTNGLGLEEGLADAVANASRDGARVFDVAGRVDPIPFGAHAGAPPESHPTPTSDAAGQQTQQHPSGSLDPHFWLDAARMARAARLIAEELGKATNDPATFQRCGANTGEALMALDAQVRQVLAAVPAQRRVLITDHDAFGYFAAAYDFQVAGVVIPGGSTLAKPSSAEIADLVKVIRARQVPVIFSNVAVSQDLVATVAREAGTQVKVVPLFVGSLGKAGSGAETYQAMLRTNAQRIADALVG